MSWITVVWAMIASACLTLAGVHLFVWVRQRAALANLMFALVAVGTAAMAAIELLMMKAATPADYAWWLRWYHAPVWVVVASLVGFIHFHLRAGRAWLAWATIAARTLSLGFNFFSGANLNYREISSLQRIPLLGEPASVPLGAPNPWMLLGQFSLLLLIAYIVDASVTAARRGDRRLALVVGGSTAAFVAASTAQAVLVYWQLLPMPMTPSLFFTGMVLAMGYELSSRVLRAAQIAQELQEREAELRQERTLTDAVFDSVPGLLYLYTADGRFVRWNRQHETRTGFSRAEMTQMTPSDWFAPEDLPALRQAWTEALTGGNVTTELPVKMKDGARVPYLLTGVRVMIDGQAHVVGIGIDIAQRKAIELDAARLRSELAHLSRVATLNELSGSIAHELNQPLGIILANAQAAQRLLTQNPPDLAEVRDILNDIVAEDRRAGEVIKRLRALLKGGELSFQSLDVNELVQEVLTLMRSEWVGRGIGLDLQLTPKLPWVWGDRVALQQVLLNLLTNACDSLAASEPTERRLTIITRREDNSIKISVCDTGGGLPAQADRIFDSFFTTKTQGLGLGLAICRNLVTAHQGKIWAEANRERGATFHVTLPPEREAA